MNLNNFTEKIFFRYLSKKPELFQFITPKFFQDKHIQVCYKIEKTFYEKYHKIPNKSQIKEIIKNKEVQAFIHINDNQEKVLKEGIIDSLYDVDVKEYDETWLEENFEAWVQFKNLDLSVFEVIDYLKTTAITPDNIKDTIEKVKEIIVRKNNFELKFDEGLDFYDEESYIEDDHLIFSTGYPWFDLLLGGGFRQKSLTVFAGRPKVGKSIILSNFVARAIKSGHDTAFISFELPAQECLKRVACNLLSIDYDEFDGFKKDKSKLSDRIRKFKNSTQSKLVKPGSLVIKEFPQGSAGVPDVESYLNKMEELRGSKFKFVVVDYINIMKNHRNPNSENLYVKIKQISEDLRALSSRNEYAILSATQLNREGSKSSKIDMGDISESVGLIATVDALIAIDNPDIIDDNENQFSFSPLAIRYGKKINDLDKIYFDMNYKYMRMTEKI